VAFMVIITILFLLLYAALIFFYHQAWKKLPVFEAPAEQRSFLSVVIALRNESANVEGLLYSLQQQHYPVDSFEVILVNDFSTDDTAQKIQQQLPANAFLLQPDGEAAHSSKKKAIAFGIAKARGELIVTTDADCRFHPDWLSSLNAFYRKTGSRFIAAPVKYQYRNDWLSQLQALDFMVLQGITGAAVSMRLHALCNGANLAYQRKVFYEVKGFEGIDGIASGDDLLLMQKIRDRFPDRVHYLKSAAAIVSTTPMPDWNSLLMQRRRWASKTFHYTDHKLTATLGFVFLFNLWFLALLVAGLFQPICLLYALAFVLLKTAIEWPFVASVSRFFGEEELMKRFLFFQPVHIIYTVLTGLLSQWGKYEWKGRRTK
jgi:cellulose synthase/poly-beta-1,6-N-acetylglucosamine synthase-like glycosyltransferase